MCFRGRKTSSLLLSCGHREQKPKDQDVLGVVLEAGSPYEAGRRGQGSERGMGVTAVLTLETGDWEVRLNMRKQLWWWGVRDK